MIGMNHICFALPLSQLARVESLSTIISLIGVSTLRVQRLAVRLLRVMIANPDISARLHPSFVPSASSSGTTAPGSGNAIMPLFLARTNSPLPAAAAITSMNQKQKSTEVSTIDLTNVS